MARFSLYQPQQQQATQPVGQAVAQPTLPTQPGRRFSLYKPTTGGIATPTTPTRLPQPQPTVTPSQPSDISQGFNLAKAGTGLLSTGAKLGTSTGLLPADSGLGDTLGVLRGLTTIGSSLAGEGSDVSKAAGSLGGALTTYNSLANLAGMTPIPYANYIGAALGTVPSIESIANQKYMSDLEKALQSANVLGGAAGSIFDPTGGILAGGFTKGFGTLIHSMFKEELPHEVREGMEGSNIGLGVKNMLSDIQGAGTEQELRDVLSHWQQGGLGGGVRVGVSPQFDITSPGLLDRASSGGVSVAAGVRQDWKDAWNQAIQGALNNKARSLQAAGPIAAQLSTQGQNFTPAEVTKAVQVAPQATTVETLLPVVQQVRFGDALTDATETILGTAYDQSRVPRGVVNMWQDGPNAVHGSWRGQLQPLLDQFAARGMSPGELNTITVRVEDAVRAAVDARWPPAPPQPNFEDYYAQQSQSYF